MPGDPAPGSRGEGDVTVSPSAGRVTFTGYSPEVNLGKEADRAEISITDRIALRTQTLRERVARGIMLLFIVANIGTPWAVYRLVALDQSNNSGALDHTR